jgi:hypothetical protein
MVRENDGDQVVRENDGDQVVGSCEKLKYCMELSGRQVSYIQQKEER